VTASVLSSVVPFSVSFPKDLGANVRGYQAYDKFTFIGY
jgi:hypothetical protein